jgi:aminoglycoside/choline kinase family phosphotransferase
MSRGVFDGMDLEPALHAVWGELPTQLDILKLKGDASTRSYYRVSSATATPASLIVMRLPADALKSDELTGDDRPSELPFLNLQRHLQARGVPVPRVLVSDLARGLVLLEDLGDETFEARLTSSERGQWLPLYREAVALLVRLHAAMSCSRADPRASTAARDPACVAYDRSFDRALLR